MTLPTNIHAAERTVRAAAGFFLVLFAFFATMNPWFLLGFVPLLTGLTGYCPLYQVLRINTRTWGVA